MQTNTTISASALEKLKRLAKQHRDTSGLPLAAALEAVAQQAGYQSWKQVTLLASNYKAPLMPASHRWRGHWVAEGSHRMQRCETVEELCAALGGVEPVLLRSHCNESRPGARCLCELDPFVTAKRANVAIDIGDKHDHWHYLYFADRPYDGVNIVDVRLNLGLGSHGHYLNEHLLTGSNDDRSDSLNVSVSPPAFFSPPRRCRTMLPFSTTRRNGHGRNSEFRRRAPTAQRGGMAGDF